MNVKLKFKQIWICFMIIFISSTNGTQIGSRTSVTIKEDPLVDKVTKVNHNLKLVTLKKVKKVYTNLPDEGDGVSQASRRPTIIDLNAKYNLATQTPIPFLITDKSTIGSINLVDKNLIDSSSNQPNNDQRNLGKQDHHSNGHGFGGDSIDKDLNKSLNDSSNNLKSNNQTSNNNDSKITKFNKNSLSFSRTIQKSKDKPTEAENQIKSDSHLNEIINRSDHDHHVSDRQEKPINRSLKIAFPNKFKNSLDHLNKANGFTYSMNYTPKPVLLNKPTTIRSTIKNDLLNRINSTKISLKSSTQQIAKIKSTTQPKKLNKFYSKPDQIKAFMTTTTESSRLFTYKPKTTTFKPYIYTPVSVTTSTPVLRIRKSFPKSINTVSIKPSIDNDQHKDSSSNSHKYDIHNDSKLEPVNQPTSEKNVLNARSGKSDLESNNSNRKYAKLFFDANKIKKDEKTTTTESPRATTQLAIYYPSSTESYFRLNSRISTPFSPFYTAYTNQYRTTTSSPQKKSSHGAAESNIKNEIDDDTRVLKAVRRKPIYRPRTVRPTQLIATTTIAPHEINKIIETNDSRLTNESTNSYLTTTYSPRFRSTTTYSPRFRSTTVSTLEQFKTSKYM